MSDPDVKIDFPGTTQFVRLARLNAAAIAGELGFDVESVEDLRLAVGELASLMVEGDHGKRVSISYHFSTRQVQVAGSTEGPGIEPVEVNDLADALVAATADGYRFESGSGWRRFELSKSFGG